MRRKIKIMQIIILLSGCGNNEFNKQNIPLPPPPDNRCSIMRANTYENIKTGKIKLVFNDTFKEAIKGYYLDSILENQFHFTHLPVFNLNFTNCIQPIMDSAIAAKFGENAKDSIINEAYRLTEIVYNKENK